MADNTPIDPQADALLREVDEQVRHDQMVALWKRYGSFVIGIAILIVLTSAGFQGWKAWRGSQRTADAVAYEMAITQATAGDRSAAAASLAALQQSASTGYGAVAALQRAAILIEEDKIAEAVTVYQGVAADTSVAKELRDLATLLAVMNGINLPDADLAALDATVATLAVPGNAYRHSAMETRGLIAMARGETEQALKTFQELAADATAPRGVADRAKDMIAALGGTATAPSAGQ